ncbi:hypothetical protein [Fulvimonas yonginensis]|uniref:Uncharacterized protein n=1 Tax=Fulvimonas yonginensis TaxID=1495200 RepID=A0ABU8JA89_9GAMM
MPRTRTELLRVLTAAAGLPMNVDQIVEQMPVGTDRKKVGELCRELKDQGLLTATVEEGRVAYALADPLPANVTPINGRRQNRPESTIDKVRELLGKATEPMTLSDIVAALPGEEQKKIQRVLHQGTHRGEFESKPAGARAKAYAPKGGGIAIAIASSPASADAPAPSDSTDQAAPGSPLEQALHSAEKARDAYLEFVVASQSVWQALETSVTACRAALEAQRHA